MPGKVGGHAQTTLTWVYSNWEEFSQKSDMAGWNTCSAQGKSSTNGNMFIAILLGYHPMISHYSLIIVPLYQIANKPLLP
jgi:hypothetical protein